MFHYCTTSFSKHNTNNEISLMFKSVINIFNCDRVHTFFTVCANLIDFNITSVMMTSSLSAKFTLSLASRVFANLNKRKIINYMQQNAPVYVFFILKWVLKDILNLLVDQFLKFHHCHIEREVL